MADGSGTATAALVSAIDFAAELNRPLLHIRVARDAIPNSICTVAITPERARTERLLAIPDGVVADPDVSLRAMEVVIHPADWHRVLAEVPDQYVAQRVDLHLEAGTGAEVTFCGVKVRCGP